MKTFLQYITEKTLFHGTLIDYEDTIKKYGLVGGWHGVGKFVKQFYDDQDLRDEDLVVFMADKKSLEKSVNAMVFNIADKLNKDFHDVTINDIRNHGLLAIIKDVENVPQYDPKDYSQQNAPFGVELGDYYVDQIKTNMLLKGPALIRFLIYNKAITGSASRAGMTKKVFNVFH